MNGWREKACTVKHIAMRHFIVFGLSGIYIAWTLKFAIEFNRTENYFDKKQKRIHNILIWMIPFIWIVIIKTVTKPVHGSMKYNRTSKNEFKENGSIWGGAGESNSGAEDHQ